MCNNRLQLCPNAPEGAMATVDDDGLCTLHGWDCDVAETDDDDPDEQPLSI